MICAMYFICRLLAVDFGWLAELFVVALFPRYQCRRIGRQLSRYLAGAHILPFFLHLGRHHFSVPLDIYARFTR